MQKTQIVNKSMKSLHIIDMLINEKMLSSKRQNRISTSNIGKYVEKYVSCPYRYLVNMNLKSSHLITVDNKKLKITYIS